MTKKKTYIQKIFISGTYGYYGLPDFEGFRDYTSNVKHLIGFETTGEPEDYCEGFSAALEKIAIEIRKEAYEWAKNEHLAINKKDFTLAGVPPTWSNLAILKEFPPEQLP